MSNVLEFVTDEDDPSITYASINGDYIGRYRISEVVVFGQKIPTVAIYDLDDEVISAGFDPAFAKVYFEAKKADFDYMDTIVEATGKTGDEVADELEKQLLRTA
jgi:ribonucleotide reductase alpha subunit